MVEDLEAEPQVHTAKLIGLTADWACPCCETKIEWVELTHDAAERWIPPDEDQFLRCHGCDVVVQLPCVLAALEAADA